MELISQLTSKLGIDESVAKQGLGTIGNFAKGQLSEENYAKLSAAIPGLGSMEAKAEEGKGGGIGGMLGGIGGGLAKNLGSIGGVAELLAKLKSLGLSEEQIMGFVSQVTNFLEQKGMGDLAATLKGVLPTKS